MRTVGGTMVSRILGLSKWGGSLSAYVELTGEPDTTPRNTAMSRGVALEESVLRLCMEHVGFAFDALVIPRACVRAQTLPHAHATIDAWILGEQDHGGDAFFLVPERTT